MKFSRLLPVLFGVSCSFCAASMSQGAIVSVSGSAQVLPIPPDVAGDVYESDTTIAVFNERQGESLTSNLSVDATAAKFYSDPSDLTPGTIAAGTVVNSYLIHFDKVGNGDPFIFRSGSVTFDTPVLGLMSSRTDLVPSDAVLGAPGTIYGTGQNLGIDFNTGDTFSLSADLRTVSFDLGTSVGEDHLRIVTAAPEPASLAVLVVAAICCLASTRNRIASI